MHFSPSRTFKATPFVPNHSPLKLAKRCFTSDLPLSSRSFSRPSRNYHYPLEVLYTETTYSLYSKSITYPYMTSIRGKTPPPSSSRLLSPIAIL